MPDYDVIVSATGGGAQPTSQQWGTAVMGAPRAANQLSVVNRNYTLNSTTRGGYAADPSGVVNKYSKRFDDISYYTA
jgi:hypothetical protein